MLLNINSDAIVRSPTPSSPQIVQELRRGLHAGHQQMVPGARAGDMKQVAFGVPPLAMRSGGTLV
jgi:hypothetical protein